MATRATTCLPQVKVASVTAYCAHAQRRTSRGNFHVTTILTHNEE